MKIKLKKINPEIKMPSYAHDDDAGLDLYAQESFLLEPGERHDFELGFALEIPQDFVGLVWDKSGLALKYGIHILGGVVDAGYRGEIKIILINLGEKPHQVEEGDKIAQLLLQKIEKGEIEIVEKLSESKRSDKGFGSSGKK